MTLNTGFRRAATCALTMAAVAAAAHCAAAAGPMRPPPLGRATPLGLVLLRAPSLRRSLLARRAHTDGQKRHWRFPNIVAQVFHIEEPSFPHTSPMYVLLVVVLLLLRPLVVVVVVLLLLLLLLLRAAATACRCCHRYVLLLPLHRYRYHHSLSPSFSPGTRGSTSTPLPPRPTTSTRRPSARRRSTALRTWTRRPRLARCTTRSTRTSGCADKR